MYGSIVCKTDKSALVNFKNSTVTSGNTQVSSLLKSSSTQPRSKNPGAYDERLIKLAQSSIQASYVENGQTILKFNRQDLNEAFQSTLDKQLTLWRDIFSYKQILPEIGTSLKELSKLHLKKHIASAPGESVTIKLKNIPYTLVLADKEQAINDSNVVVYQDQKLCTREQIKKILPNIETLLLLKSLKCIDDAWNYQTTEYNTSFYKFLDEKNKLSVDQENAKHQLERTYDYLNELDLFNKVPYISLVASHHRPEYKTCKDSKKLLTGCKPLSYLLLEKLRMVDENQNLSFKDISSFPELIKALSSIPSKTKINLFLPDAEKRPSFNNLHTSVPADYTVPPRKLALVNHWGGDEQNQHPKYSEHNFLGSHRMYRYLKEDQLDDQHINKFHDSRDRSECQSFRKIFYNLDDSDSTNSSPQAILNYDERLPENRKSITQLYKKVVSHNISELKNDARTKIFIEKLTKSYIQNNFTQILEAINQFQQSTENQPLKPESLHKAVDSLKQMIINPDLKLNSQKNKYSNLKSQTSLASHLKKSTRDNSEGLLVNFNNAFTTLNHYLENKFKPMLKQILDLEVNGTLNQSQEQLINKELAENLINIRDFLIQKQFLYEGTFTDGSPKKQKLSLIELTKMVFPHQKGVSKNLLKFHQKEVKGSLSVDRNLHIKHLLDSYDAVNLFIKHYKDLNNTVLDNDLIKADCRTEFSDTLNTCHQLANLLSPDNDIRYINDFTKLGWIKCLRELEIKDYMPAKISTELTLKESIFKLFNTYSKSKQDILRNITHTLNIQDYNDLAKLDYSYKADEATVKILKSALANSNAQLKSLAAKPRPYTLANRIYNLRRNPSYNEVVNDLLNLVKINKRSHT